MKSIILSILVFTIGICCSAKINKFAVLKRNNPVNTSMTPYNSLSVGNGEFAYTCDVTGLQTFPDYYTSGIPLCTMSQWGWHSFPNPENYTEQDALQAKDFGRGREEYYSCQGKTGRAKTAADWLRSNPHRLNLARIGFEDMDMDNIYDITQELDLPTGRILSSFMYKDTPFDVVTQCHDRKDMVMAAISDTSHTKVGIHFPYPTGAHCDDASNWKDKGNSHNVYTVSQKGNVTVLCHEMDAQKYFVRIITEGVDTIVVKYNTAIITPSADNWTLRVEFCKDAPQPVADEDYDTASYNAREYWWHYWEKGGMIDCSKCKDPLARELERRVVLSLYLTAIQCAGSTPPQETGLTYNSWFGKFHLEMTWWHMAHFALWGHPEMLERTLPWYHTALGKAKEIAERQGFDGARWMKMTDPSGNEAPSNVGSFLIWQQPHFIYLAELLYRAKQDSAVINEYADIVDETAQFMASFATYDASHDRYILKGCIPAQETLKAGETVNPPFELSYWHFALSTAQKWRERQGLQRCAKWDTIITKLSCLDEKDSVYTAAESAQSYNMENMADVPTTLYSDHPAVLAAYGVLPKSPQFSEKIMTNTLAWVTLFWNWKTTWGWDYPVISMCATRLKLPELSVKTLLKRTQKNTYLTNGHNYQDTRLRCYLPGNGGLLSAVALMCAGWDGCDTPHPGIPDDPDWDIEYEGILPMP